ncbi:class I SAM-dependent methyltransferase [soil metagenome]
MPSLVLKKRAPNLRERMDDPACSLDRLHATYRQFGPVNQLFAAWHAVYAHYLRPQLAGSPATLLDIGCGGGDLARRLAAWGKRDGLELHITAADPDARAFEYARSRPAPPNVTFCRALSSDLVAAGRRFDVVVSNHLLHHLTDQELTGLCRDSECLATKLVLHNDIRRSALAYLGFNATRLFFRNSFIVADGLTSIRRSFSPAELETLAPPGWTVEAVFPYRNLLVYRS